MFRVTDKCGFCTEFEPGQNDSRSFGHEGLHEPDVCLQLFQGRFDQKGIVDRHADPQPGFGGQTGGNPHHFGRVRLHGKVEQRARRRVREHKPVPAENHAHPTAEHRVAGQCCGDGGFLCTPLDISEAIHDTRLDQAAQLSCCTED